MNKNIDINVLLDKLRIQSPVTKPFTSPNNRTHQKLIFDDKLCYSANSTPTSSGYSSINTTPGTPGTPEAVRISGGVSTIPLDILEKLSLVMRKKSNSSTESFNSNDVEYLQRRDKKVKELRKRSIKNPIFKKFFEKKKKD
uniref:KID domain-containing protein n=1 Tax=Parastrongyloides trichosuri TaxID=131310 RepID=A0A0N4ZLV9_PARTI